MVKQATQVPLGSPRSRNLRRQAERNASLKDRRARDLLVAQMAPRCYLCGQLIDVALKWPHPRSASIEHIVAIADGGTNSASNLSLSHLEENISRGAQPVTLWRAKRGIDPVLPGDIKEEDPPSRQVDELEHEINILRIQVQHWQDMHASSKEAGHFYRDMYMSTLDRRGNTETTSAEPEATNA